MTASVRTLILLAGCLLVAMTAAAGAGVGLPGPYPFIMPGNIDVVGSNSGVPDARGQFTVTALDYGYSPIPGIEIRVCIDCPDIRICAALVPPGQTNSCTPAQCVAATTDANGVATFIICGATTNTGGSAVGCGTFGAKIYADMAEGWLWMGQATVAVFDQNGAVTNPGVEITDLSAWLSDFAKQGTIGYKGRSDYGHNGTVDVVDLSFWLKFMSQGGSRQGCVGGYCP
jgi:hypothetical protein